VDSLVEEIQKKFDETGRAILRFLEANKNELTPTENVKLAKFMFGCMNQKFTIASRVQLRGSAELGKAMTFIGRAAETILKVDERLRKKEGP
jgi:phage host-nuclease inhibitor protein Gam